MNSKERDPRIHAIIGAVMEVHKEMGPGFLVYDESIVEIQVERCLTKEDEAQIISSLMIAKLIISPAESAGFKPISHFVHLFLYLFYKYLH